MFDCFPLIPCLFIIIVQCLYHQWKPRSTTSVIWLLLHFWFTIFSSCLRYSLMRFLSILNFLEADEIFLQFSKVTRVWLCISLISGMYDFLSVFFFFFFFFFFLRINAMPLRENIRKTKHSKWECSVSLDDIPLLSLSEWKEWLRAR